MVGMNTSKIVVRLDAERRTAELEIRTPHLNPRLEGLELALCQIGIRPLYTVELLTPRFHITRSKLVARDDSELDSTRVMQILCAAQDPTRSYESLRSRRAA
jgi:hypothetical protein